jgi:hypothetical protein
MIANLAGQPIGTQMTALDGSPFTGVVTVYVTGDNGVQVVGSVAGGLCVHEGLGYHSYLTSAVDTNYLRHLAFTFVGGGAVTRTVQTGLPYSLLRDLAGQVVGCQMTALDGSDFAGAVALHVTGDNGVQSVGGAAALKGFGYYGYAPALGETNFSQVAFTFSGTGAITKTIEIDTLTAAQAGALQAATEPGVRYVLELIKNALYGLNVYGSGEPIKPADATLALFWLNVTLNAWNLDPQTSYAATFTTVVTTGANPETLGPSGTVVLAARPVALDGVAVDRGVGYVPIFSTNDPAWWERQLPLTAGLASGAYYAASVPNGALYFLDPPAAGTLVRLRLRTRLSAVRLTDALMLPEGYELALTLTLMEAIAEPFHATVSASLARRAGLARGGIFAKNLRVPSLSAAGLGLPGTDDGCYYDYRTGGWR